MSSSVANCEADDGAYTRGGGGSCSACRSLSYSQEWLVAFNVFLCHECKRHEHLISKGTAKELYAVTDGDLKNLGSLSRTNPHRKDWSQMRLYLESQVRALALSKYGGVEELESARDGSLQRKTERRLKRRRKEEDMKEAERRQLENFREQIDRATPDHAVKEELHDVSTGKYRRQYSDGIVVDVEKL